MAKRDHPSVPRTPGGHLRSVPAVEKPAVGTKSVGSRTECPVCGESLLLLSSLKWRIDKDGRMVDVKLDDPRIIQDDHELCFGNLPLEK